jgi:hypothetical protein
LCSVQSEILRRRTRAPDGRTEATIDFAPVEVLAAGSIVRAGQGNAAAGHHHHRAARAGARRGLRPELSRRARAAPERRLVDGSSLGQRDDCDPGRRSGTEARGGRTASTSAAKAVDIAQQANACHCKADGQDGAGG